MEKDLRRLSDVLAEDYELEEFIAGSAYTLTGDYLGLITGQSSNDAGGQTVVIANTVSYTETTLYSTSCLRESVGYIAVDLNENRNRIDSEWDKLPVLAYDPALRAVRNVVKGYEYDGQIRVKLKDTDSIFTSVRSMRMVKLTEGIKQFLHSQKVGLRYIKAELASPSVFKERNNEMVKDLKALNEVLDGRALTSKLIGCSAYRQYGEYLGLIIGSRWDDFDGLTIRIATNIHYCDDTGYWIEARERLPENIYVDLNENCEGTKVEAGKIPKLARDDSVSIVGVSCCYMKGDDLLVEISDPEDDYKDITKLSCLEFTDGIKKFLESHSVELHYITYTETKEVEMDKSKKLVTLSEVTESVRITGGSVYNMLGEYVGIVVGVDVSSAPDVSVVVVSPTPVSINGSYLEHNEESTDIKIDMHESLIGKMIVDKLPRLAYRVSTQKMVMTKLKYGESGESVILTKEYQKSGMTGYQETDINDLRITDAIIKFADHTRALDFYTRIGDKTVDRENRIDIGKASSVFISDSVLQKTEPKYVKLSELKTPITKNTQVWAFSGYSDMGGGKFKPTYRSVGDAVVCDGYVSVKLHSGTEGDSSEFYVKL